MYSRLGDQRRATENAWDAIAMSTAIGDGATLGKAHGLLALESYWSGQPAAGVVQGRKAVQQLEDRPDQRWWLGMAHFYLALNHLLAGEFDNALSASARADTVGVEIGDPRLQTYAAYIVGWTEASRGRHDVAIATCRRSVAQAPDRVSRAYASLFLGYALVERGGHREALAVLDAVVTELEEFAIPQWLALATALRGESLRALDRIGEAEGAVQRALQVATRSGYTYAVGMSHLIAGRLARDRGSLGEARAALERALETFERSGAVFEIGRSRLELAQLEQTISCTPQ
jgi:tetratricopeptide (TPR) repeat protein